MIAIAAIILPPPHYERMAVLMFFIKKELHFFLLVQTDIVIIASADRNQQLIKTGDWTESAKFTSEKPDRYLFPDTSMKVLRICPEALRQRQEAAALIQI